MGQLTDHGYLALPESGKGPAVVVIQEWWGLVPHIENVVERFAAENFLAIAPDLYHGAKTTSPDEAKKLRMELDMERAEREIADAGEYLLKRPECSSRTFGVVGFCMGGGLAQYAATRNENVGAAVSFYGGLKNVKPDWENLHGPIILIYGEKDESLPAEQGFELETQLRSLGKTVEVIVYAGADHAFFNDHRPEVYNATAAEDAWRRTVEFFRKHLQS